jgi:hypothetical protein
VDSNGSGSQLKVVLIEHFDGFGTGGEAMVGGNVGAQIVKDLIGDFS